MSQRISCSDIVYFVNEMAFGIVDVAYGPCRLAVITSYLTRISIDTHVVQDVTSSNQLSGFSEDVTENKYKLIGFCDNRYVGTLI